MSATQRYGVGVAAVGRQLSYDLHTENGNRRAEYVAVKFIRQVADPRPLPRVFDFIRQTASAQLGSLPGHVMSDLRLLKKILFHFWIMFWRKLNVKCIVHCFCVVYIVSILSRFFSIVLFSRIRGFQVWRCFHVRTFFTCRESSV